MNKQELKQAIIEKAGPCSSKASIRPGISLKKESIGRDW